MTGHWAAGDRYGLAFPADPATLRGGGARFLTDAFRRSGVLGADNRVARIARFEVVDAGSTGRKVVVTVEYDRAAPELHTDLFVKFSRDFDNPTRDLGRTQMDAEVRFAGLSRMPDFPIAVPSVLFADYHRETGTGLLITERIWFGTSGIEPHYQKCLDYDMPEPLEHYRALLTALARLAGTHRSGRLPAGLAADFPLDVAAATVGERVPLSPEKLDKRVTRLADFVAAVPGQMPTGVRAPEFLDRLRTEVPLVARHEAAVEQSLAADANYVALCHWNANVDNAWFWRDGPDGRGALRCGLMDWGCVSQMNVGMALWGALSGAETGLWDEHFDELLHAFVTEFSRCGGPPLDPDRLRRHTVLYAAVMGVAWLLDVPALLLRRFGDALPGSRTDPRIRDDESVRAPLQMLTNLLNVWERHCVGELLDDAQLGAFAAVRPCGG